MTDSFRSISNMSLTQAQQQFEQWRAKQPKRSRLPDDLWSLAVDLAGRFGVSRTAKVLRLDHNKLKAKCQIAQSVISHPMTFLELNCQQAPVECIIDCHQSADTRKMHLRLTGPGWPDLTELCQGFWRS